MWLWLQGLSGGAANFVGSLTGAAIGLIALLIGALFNAHLNRLRDDRIRLADARALAAAIKAELDGLERTLLTNANDLESPRGDFYVPDLAHSVRISPHLFSKLGLLNIDTIHKVVDAYIIVDQYCERLIMLGGKIDQTMPAHRRLVLMPAAAAPKVVILNRGGSALIREATAELGAYI